MLKVDRQGEAIHQNKTLHLLNTYAIQWPQQVVHLQVFNSDAQFREYPCLALLDSWKGIRKKELK